MSSIGKSMTLLTPRRKSRIGRIRPIQSPNHRGAENLVCDSGSHSYSSDKKTDGRDIAAWDSAAATSNLAIREQLSRILQSKTFIQSDKLSRFLRFVVEHVLDGDAGCLKEYVIGVEVYDRKPPYHPSQDSIVRTEARRLRGKLKEFYETEGKHDPVYVYLRPGSYVPVFHHKDDLISTDSPYPKKSAPMTKPSPTGVLILPFTNGGENAVSAVFARGIADELSYALMMTYGCMVISPSERSMNTHDHYRGDLMRRVGATFACEGSVRTHGKHLRVTARIVNTTGVQLWVKRIDADATFKGHFALEERIASVLSAGFDGFLV